jgi:hypothetical protein
MSCGKENPHDPRFFSACGVALVATGSGRSHTIIFADVTGSTAPVRTTSISPSTHSAPTTAAVDPELDGRRFVPFIGGTCVRFGRAIGASERCRSARRTALPALHLGVA